jgi:hypothetical protein
VFVEVKREVSAGEEVQHEHVGQQESRKGSSTDSEGSEKMEESVAKSIPASKRQTAFLIFQ